MPGNNSALANLEQVLGQWEKDKDKLKIYISTLGGKKIEAYKTEADQIYRIQQSLFACISSLKGVDVPEALKKRCIAAYKELNKLMESITVPNSYTGLLGGWEVIVAAWDSQLSNASTSATPVAAATSVPSPAAVAAAAPAMPAAAPTPAPVLAQQPAASVPAPVPAAYLRSAKIVNVDAKESKALVDQVVKKLNAVFAKLHEEKYFSLADRSKLTVKENDDVAYSIIVNVTNKFDKNTDKVCKAFDEVSRELNLSLNCHFPSVTGVSFLSIISADKFHALLACDDATLLQAFKKQLSSQNELKNDSKTAGYKPAVKQADPIDQLWDDIQKAIAEAKKAKSEAELEAEAKAGTGSKTPVPFYILDGFMERLLIICEERILQGKFFDLGEIVALDLIYRMLTLPTLTDMYSENTADLTRIIPILKQMRTAQVYRTELPEEVKNEQAVARARQAFRPFRKALDKLYCEKKGNVALINARELIWQQVSAEIKRLQADPAAAKIEFATLSIGSEQSIIYSVIYWFVIEYSKHIENPNKICVEFFPLLKQLAELGYEAAKEQLEKLKDSVIELEANKAAAVAPASIITVPAVGDVKAISTAVPLAVAPAPAPASAPAAVAASVPQKLGVLATFFDEKVLTILKTKDAKEWELVAPSSLGIRERTGNHLIVCANEDGTNKLFSNIKNAKLIPEVFFTRDVTTTVFSFRPVKDCREKFSQKAICGIEIADGDLKNTHLTKLAKILAKYKDPKIKLDNKYHVALACFVIFAQGGEQALIKAIDHLRFEQHALFLEELKRKKVKDAEDELGDIFADLPKLQEALNKQIIIRELTSADASATSAAAAAPAPAVAPALANAHKPSFRDSKHVAPASLGSSAVAGSMNDATLIAHVADAKKMPKTFDSMTTEEIIEQINDQMTAWENDKDKLASLLFINNILKEGVKNYELNRVVSGMPTQFLQFQNSIICALEEIVEKSVRISTEEIIKTEEVLHQISVLSSQWNKNFAQDILLCSRGTCALEKLKTRANMPIAAASASTVAMLEHFQTGAIVAAGAKTNNKKAAVKRYREEAEQNHAEAQYQLGLCYENGGGVIQNRKEAVKWYRKAAEQGHAAAQHKLGVCYAESIGVASDEGIAVDWYRKAAEQGYAAAQHKLGLCYAEGRGGVARDKRVAVEWHRKAAEQGYAAAQYGLGFCYERGRGIEQDLSIAIELYGKAAEQGYPLAAAAQAILNNTFRNSR